MAGLTRRVVDLMDIAELNEEKVGLLSIDIFKAFDSLQWVTIKEIVENYGFVIKFRKTIEQLYQQGSAKVRVNDVFTKGIQLKAGTRQGNPLSPILFIMAMKLLANAIRDDRNIEGIEGNKISLYADDTLVILKNPKKLLERVQMHLKEFEGMTGLKINWDKSEIIFCNTYRQR